MEKVSLSLYRSINLSIYPQSLLFLDLMYHSRSYYYNPVPYPEMSNVKTAKKVLAGYRMPQPEGCPSAVYKIMNQW